MELFDIKKLVDGMVPLLKKQFTVDARTFEVRRAKKIVGFHDTYGHSIAFRDKVKVHAEIGGYTKSLFENRAPNETDEEAMYIEKNYKQTTLDVYSDYLQTTTRPFNDGNYDLKYMGDEQEYKEELSLQYYLENEIKKFGSLQNFMTSSVAHLKGLDANGVIAIKPVNFAYTENPEDPKELILDTSILLDPQPFYYRCDQIVAKELDEYYLILMEEKSFVEYGNKQHKIGFTFEFYDYEKIVTVTQTGKYEDYQFEYDIYFPHNWGYVPVQELKGVPQVVDNKILWQSPFLYACDNLDLSLVNAQYLQASIAKVCFPFTVMVGDACTFEHKDDSTGQIVTCNEGRMLNPSTQSFYNCPKCNGSGMKVRLSPFGILLLRKEDWTGQGDKAFSERAMYHVSPETNALEFVWKKIDADTDKARKILHLYTSSSTVKGSETATFMAIDMKAMYAFIKPISNQLFEMWEFMIDAIGWMRYGEKYKKPILTYPDTFDYNTEQDYLFQIGEAQKAGLPPFVIYSIIERYLSTLYYNQSERANVFRLLLLSDRLLTLSKNEIGLCVNRGTAHKWEEILHDSAIVFVDQLKSDEGFFNKSIEEQVKAVYDLAKAKEKEISGSIEKAADDLVLNILGDQAA